MMLQLNDYTYINKDKIVKITANYDRNQIVILTDDGKEHVVVTASNGVYQKLDKLVSEINKQLVTQERHERLDSQENVHGAQLFKKP